MRSVTILRILLAIMRRTFIRYFTPGSVYIKLQYLIMMGEKLNLKNPKTFNEKIQWLKLHDRNPLYTELADKYAVRGYVSRVIGEEYLIPLIAVYNSVDEIRWDELPNQFVLKCTHSCGKNIICENKEKLDIRDAKKKLRKWMKKNFFWHGREWAYKNIRPRIICEQYMVDESGTELKDYKIFCFNGKPRFIQVDFNRFRGHKRNVYTVDWQYLDLSYNYPNQASTHIEKPKKLDEMLRCAAKLSSEFPFVRTDFYSIDEQIYIGELTFYPANGMSRFNPKEYDYILGEWLNLPDRI